MLEQVLSNIQIGLESVNSYLERLQAKQKKRKFITRLDIAVFVLLVISCIFVGIEAKNSPAASNSVPAQGAVKNAATPSNNNIGRGGAATKAAPPDCSTGQCQIDANQGVTDITNTVKVNIPTTGDWLINDDGKGHVTGAVFSTDPGKTVEDPNIQKLWGAMVSVVLACLVIIIIINGYRVMGGAFGFRYANALETLSRVFLAALGAILSSMFAAFLLAFENGLNQFIVQVMGPGSGIKHSLQFSDVVFPVSIWGAWALAFFAILLIVIVLFGISLIPAVSGIIAFFGGAAGVVAGVGLLALTLRNLILTIMSIMLAFQLEVRLLTICFYIIIGPLLVGLSAVKMDMAQKWFSGLTSLIFVQTAQVLALSVGIIFFHGVPGLMSNIPPGNWQDDFVGVVKTIASTGQSAPTIFSHLPDFIGPVAVLWLTVRIPRMFGSSALSPMISAGQTAVTGATFVGVMAGTAVGGVAGAAGRSRGGGGGKGKSGGGSGS
jgi:hypothetical protein